jgi:pyruvate/2-oxoglutarate dehydrogenase complex dihydrolipoamide dehydrogenase (E3) component/uncharacterized membrane protein YdjX (TVP38/TMEM64 family)
VTRKQMLLLVVVIAAVTMFFAFDLGRFLSLEFIRTRQAELAATYAARPLAMIAAFFAIYVAVTALSLPGATILTLAAGAIFGLLAGTLIVSFASSLGALLAFWVARTVLRDSVQRRFGARLAEIDRGIEKEGALYLVSLRLLPLFPFFVINLLMGLTRMRSGTFYLASQIGMLAGTVVYVNAGTQLAGITSLSDIASPLLVGSFVLLALFPLLAGRVVDALRARRVYAPWAHLKPRRFDRNLVVIGAGAAGLVSSYIGAAVKAKVTLIEAHEMGGDCLNRGCVPSKALIRAATLVQQMRDARRFGVAPVEARFDFAELMDRVARVVREVAPHDSVERYTQLGVDVVRGHAHIVNPWTVVIDRVDGTRQTLTTRSIIVATGSQPNVPDLPGLAQAPCVTSDTLWSLRDLPQQLLVLGGGPIGCELAQCFARLGSRVTLVETAPRLLLREDDEVSALAAAALRAAGVEVLTGHTALRCEADGTAHCLVVESNGVTRRIAFDQLLCAVGRVGRLHGYGLEALGIVEPASAAPTPARTIEADAFLQTRIPNILVAGDVAGPYQFTHTAAHQAWYAAVNALFGSVHKFKADYAVIPAATFIDPELARVGLNEREAAQQGIAVEVTRFELHELDRAIVDGATQGFVKVLTAPGRDRILGVTIVGAHAAELLAEYVLAMKHGLGLNKILGTIHTYPTFSEANKYAAGAWKRAHQPHRLLAWVARYHAWRRG